MSASALASPPSQLITPLDEKELALITAAQNGDTEAFGILSEIYQKRCYYVARGFVNNPDAAEDLTQDALIKAFKNIQTFNLDAPFFPWLYKILKNHCLNYIKKTQRRKNDSLEAMEDESFVQFEDSRESAFDGLVRNETNIYIWKAIDSLPALFREVIVMKHFHNLAYKEMADALDVPIGTIMSRLFNARKELRELLQQV